jgi:hypothetical protein
LGEVILDYNRNESYLRMSMYQGVYAEIPFSHVTFRTSHGDYGPLDPYIGCVRLDGPSRFGINSWLLDSGASVYIVKNCKHCTNLHLSEDRVKLGNTTKVPYSEQGTVHLRDRKRGLMMRIEDAKVIPRFAYNIVSLDKLLQQGYTILGKLDEMKIADPKTGKSIQLLREKTSGLYFLDVEPLKPATAVTLVVEQAIENSDVKATKTTLSYTFAHNIFAHASEIALRKTCKSLGIELVGQHEVCDGCQRAKYRAKAVSKVLTARASKPVDLTIGH